MIIARNKLAIFKITIFSQFGFTRVEGLLKRYLLISRDPLHCEFLQNSSLTAIVTLFRAKFQRGDFNMNY